METDGVERVVNLGLSWADLLCCVGYYYSVEVESLIREKERKA